MSQHPLVLVDLSSICHPLWHLSGNEPDPNWTSTQVVAKVRALASGQPHVAICADGPKSRATRQAIDPTYKAQRDAAPEALYHQIRLVIDTLRGDGFPIWMAEGHEADDVIASATAKALAESNVWLGNQAPPYTEPRNILIITADKDLCQLVGPRVTIKHALKGDVLDADGVKAKFGVRPDQMRDYLALVGDTSDNIKGAKGIGPKRAAELLGKYGTLAKVFEAGGEGLTPAVRDALVEFSSRADVVTKLIDLRADVPVPLDEAFAARVPVDIGVLTETLDAGPPPPPHSEASPDPEDRREPEKPSGPNGGDSVASQPEVLAAPAQTALIPRDYTHELEPRNMAEARQLAADMFASRLFSAYGTPAAVLSTILAGRELGLPAMASLRGMHVIEGKPVLSAGTIQALILKSPHCTYFRCTERTNARATFVGKRGDDPEVSLTFSVEDARRAWSGAPDKFDKSGWGRNPADLCVARAASKLARLLWPDVVAGFYSMEEMQD